ncbi:hypothetical protein VQ574_21235 (plasmid) [Stutzerimonas frequens]|nr:hypothetical protein [Stutzerimonas frequens]WRW29464.1 hypothetical protein VQ574_21235 [Stutzerimonas frequens]
MTMALRKSTQHGSKRQRLLELPPRNYNMTPVKTFGQLAGYFAAALINFLSRFGMALVVIILVKIQSDLSNYRDNVITL